MRDFKPAGMQEHAPEPQPRETIPYFVRTVFVVTHDRIAAGSQVHPYLVGTTCAELGAQQTVTAVAFFQSIDSIGSLALGVNLHPALAGSRQPFQQWLAYILF